MDDRRPEDDAARKTRAGSRAALRLAVSVYLLYLGYSILHDMLTGRSAMSPVLAWIAGAVFIVSGALFGWYSWKRWKEVRDA